MRRAEVSENLTDVAELREGPEGLRDRPGKARVGYRDPQVGSCGERLNQVVAESEGADRQLVQVVQPVGFKPRAFVTDVADFEHERRGELILNAETVVLRIADAVRVRRDVADAQVIRQRRAAIWQRGGEVRVTLLQVEDRILRELRRIGRAVDDYRAVVSEVARRVEARRDERVGVDAVAAANDHLLRDLVGEAHSRRDHLQVLVLEALLAKLVGEDERAWTVARARIRLGQVNHADSARNLVVAEVHLPAQAEVERQPLCRLPVVHEIETRLRHAVAEVIWRNGAVSALRRAQQETGEGVAGARSKARQFRLL